MWVMRGLLISIVLAVGQPAAAQCPGNQKTVLSCTMRDGARQVDVCIDGANITYAYGAPGAAPELTLREPVATVAHEPWPGIGRTIWEATTFINRGYAYQVAISVDRMDESAPPQGSVTVMKAGETLAHLQCDTPGTVIGIWAVSDAKEAQGLCWQPNLFQWGNCG